MKIPIIVFVCFVIVKVNSDFVQQCCEGQITIGEELYSRLVIPMPRFAEQVVRRCDGVYSAIVTKHHDTLEESNMLKLRNILNHYLRECIQITIKSGPCISDRMNMISRQYACSYEAYQSGRFSQIIEETGYKSIVNYTSLSRREGLLSNLLNAVLTLVSNLLHQVGKLVDSLLGTTLRLRPLIDSLIVVVNNLVSGVYGILESLFIKQTGQYMGRTTCSNVNRQVMLRPCNQLNRCINDNVRNFYNSTVQQVYGCMTRKSQHLDQLTINQIMNLY